MSLLTAFFIGLVSTLHCFGMCGGIVGALTMSIAPEVRAQSSRLLVFQFAYNIGRIGSYVTAGLLVGWIGQSLIELLAPLHGLNFLRIFAALFLVMLGLYIGGWYPRFAFVEQLGQPLWKKLEPLGRELLPVSTPRKALAFGMVWGWLPCGLVYSALIYAISQGGAAQAAMTMLAFGLGTLAPVMLAGMLAGRLTAIGNSTVIRRISGVLMIVMGLLSFPFILSTQWQGLFY